MAGPTLKEGRKETLPPGEVPAAGLCLTSPEACVGQHPQTPDPCIAPASEGSAETGAAHGPWDLTGKGTCTSCQKQSRCRLGSRCPDCAEELYIATFDARIAARLAGPEQEQGQRRGHREQDAHGVPDAAAADLPAPPIEAEPAPSVPAEEEPRQAAAGQQMLPARQARQARQIRQKTTLPQPLDTVGSSAPPAPVPEGGPSCTPGFGHVSGAAEGKPGAKPGKRGTKSAVAAAAAAAETTPAIVRRRRLRDVG